MTLEVRRIVTGHDSQGKAVVATDERLAGTGAAGAAAARNKPQPVQFVPQPGSVRIRFPPALSHTNLIIATRRRVRCGAKPFASAGRRQAPATMKALALSGTA